MKNIVYAKPLPELTVKVIKSVQAFRCVSETTYEVISFRAINQHDFVHLDSLGVLGIGQGYTVKDEGQFTVDSPGEVRDHWGNVLQEAVPEGTKPYAYTYHRYTVVRTCDSGD